MADIDTNLDPALLGEEYVQQMKDQQREELLAQQQARDDFKKTFGTPHGRRVYWRLLLAGHYLGTVFRKGAEIYQTTAERDWIQVNLIDAMGDADPDLMADILTMGLRQNAAEQRRLAEEERRNKQTQAD